MNNTADDKHILPEEKFKISWSFAGLIMGPFYLFMGGAYLMAFTTLLIHYLLATLISPLLALVLICLFCALAGKHFFDKYNRRKHIKLRNRLINQGWKDNDLAKELRRRERGFNFLHLISVVGALFLYWGAAIFLASIVAIVFQR